MKYREVKEDQIALFNVPTTHEVEWQDMPEFIQNKQEPFSKIIIRFGTKEDLNNFSELIGQKLTPKTKSIWYPFSSHWGNNKSVYVDES